MPRKSGLLASSALGAFLAILPAAAAAQGLKGTPTVVFGTATVTTAPDYTQVVPTSAEVVINWQPTDVAGVGTIDFLPMGAVAEFAELTGTFDYTVLNRILPVDGSGTAVSRAVAFNGAVFSRIGNFPGGNVWFYSPTGIIAGPTATFNVGGLILTTNDIPLIPGGGLYGPGGLVQFRGPAGSTGFVDVQAGAEIDASAGPFGPGYVALIAPRVTQAGLVQANGQVAYLAAEQLDMTINGGLFDIVITVGTTDTQGIVHTGTTTGPASTSAADFQRISMVALPKNDALTMMLAGSVGYTPAAVAANEGSSVVLGAGFTTDNPTTVPANRLGSIAIGDATFSNALTAYATGDIAVAPGTTTAFESLATLYALDTIDVTAAVSAQVTAASDLALYAGEPGVGGTITLNALGGQIAVANSLIANASADAALFAGPSTAVDAVGGQVAILADGGTVSALNALVTVDAFGGFGAALGGNAAAGAIDLSVVGGGTISAGFLDLSARGFGGASADLGGDGSGGAINVSDIDGTLDFDPVFISAFGSGGAADVTAGSGSGGSVAISIASQAQAWDSLSVDASASTGVRLLPTALTAGATAAADAISLSVTGTGALSLTGDLVLTANSITDVNGTAGYAGQAGTVDILIGSGGDLSVAGMIFAHASALTGADGSIPSPDSSPLQQGGTVSLLADGGSITADGLNLVASAVGTGAFAAAGSATGGTATASVLNGGTLQLDLAGVSSLVEIRADGYGAPGPIAADAFGGTARLQAEDGSITVAGLAMVSANGASAELSSVPAGGGFDALGGSASVDLLAGTLGTGVIDVLDLRVQALGDARAMPVGGSALPGGDPVMGDGGTGTGGSASLSIAAGTLTLGAATIDTTGRGGASAAIDAASAWQSGDGVGGSSQLVQSGGTATIGALGIVSPGLGGGGAPAAAGSELAALAGSGTGGPATLTLSGGSLTATDTLIDAGGVGATGMDHGGSGNAGDGGAGTAGAAALVAPGGWNGSFTTGTLTLSSIGQGGNGGTAAGGTDGSGGAGTGTSATVDLADGAFSLGDVSVGAPGSGGNGAVGGAGTGGLARFAVVDSPAGPVGPRTLDSLFVGASGVGGTGAGGISGPSSAGTVALVANTLDAASGIVISGSAVLDARFGVAGPASGVTIDVAGAPLAIGGNLTVHAAGDIDIAAAAALSAAADAFFSAGRAFTSTGLVASNGILTVQGATGVTAERLSSGATTFLGAANGPLTVSVDLASAGAVTAIGRSVNITSLGALTFADLDATAGSLSVTTAGNLALATADATGAITLASTGGSIAASGAVNSGGAVAASGATGVSFAGLTSGGTTLLNAPGGAIAVTSLTSPGPVTASGQSVAIASPGALAFADLDATAGDLSVVAAGNLALATADATGAATLRSTGGAVTATGAVNAGGTATIQGLTGVTLPFLASGGNPLIEATSGQIAIAELLTFGGITARGLGIDIASTGGLFFQEATATAGDITLLAAGELVTGTVGATGLVDLRSSADYMRAAGNVTGGTIVMTAFDRIEASGNLVSASTLMIDAGGSFSLSGAARGTSVSVLSSDIAIGATASIGSRGVTQDLTLAHRNPATTMFIGGGAEPSGYSLEAAEAARLFADGSISLASTGDIAVRDLALTFGAAGNIGTGGELEISTPARIAISGDVALTTSSANDTFLIDPTLVELDSSTGSIAMLDAGGNPLGQLEIVGDTIAVASTAALPQLRTLTDMAAINALLDTPGGAALPLRAGTVAVTADDAFLVQNSGASTEYADRRGFASGGLEITTTAPTTRIVVNGQILTATGPVSGLETAPLIRINGAAPAAGGQFDAASTINGCVIGANCAPPPEPDPHFPLPTSEDVDPIPGEGPGSRFAAQLIKLAGTDPLIAPPLVDEPITGVGNDDLWEPRCDPRNDDDACPEADGER